MNKLLGSIVFVAYIFFPQVSYSLLQERNTFEMRKKTLSNPTVKRDFSSMHRHEINWNLFEIGMPLMPKMTNYSSPLPTLGGIGYGYRPFKSSPLLVQAFLKFALYGRSNSTVTHTM